MREVHFELPADKIYINFTEPEDVTDKIFPEEYMSQPSDIEVKLLNRYNIDDYLQPTNFVQ